MSSSRPQLISLFEAISSNREDLALDDFDAITIAWVIQSPDRSCIARCAEMLEAWQILSGLGLRRRT